MSIALSMKVEALENQVEEMRDKLIHALDGWEQALHRIDALEQARKPASQKPKDNNG